MDYNLVELEYFRLHPHIQSLKQNHYSDKRIYNYQQSLLQLCAKLGKKINGPAFSKTDNLQLRELQDILLFIKTSIECLRDSTLNLIPFEAIFCLEAALKEWTNGNDEVENVLVVTNQSRDYYFSDILSINKSLFSLFAEQYKVVFKQRLVLISIPKFELNDYLSNVVLYHELGHFVEKKYKITDRIFAKKMLAAKSPEEIDQVRNRKNHYTEFFCDLFAAQYIRNCCSDYLDYIANGEPDSYTHPSTNSRINLVNDFLNSRKNSTVEELKIATNKGVREKSGKARNLEIRFMEVDKTDFLNLVPVEIRTSTSPGKIKKGGESPAVTEAIEYKKLHYLFILGWELWLNKKNCFKEFGSSKNKIYEIINNLIEKSISNYIVQKTWDATKTIRKNVPE
jgi:hypothetical protein